MNARVGMTNKVRRLFCLVLLLATTGNTLSVSAQTRRASSAGAQTTPASQQKKAAPTCSAAWTGRVTYARTQSDAHSKTVPRVSGRGEDRTDLETSYNYRAPG